MATDRYTVHLAALHIVGFSSSRTQDEEKAAVDRAEGFVQKAVDSAVRELKNDIEIKKERIFQLEKGRRWDRGLIDELKAGAERLTEELADAERHLPEPPTPGAER